MCLVKCRYDCDQIAKIYDDLAVRVFNKDISFLRKMLLPAKLAGSVLNITDSFYDTKEAERMLFGIPHATKPFNEKITQDETNLAIITTLANNNDLPMPLLIRNYNAFKFKDLSKHSKKSMSMAMKMEKLDHLHEYNEFLFTYHLPGINICKNWEAARATSAAPIFFKHMELSMSEKLRNKNIKRNLSKLVFNTKKYDLKLTRESQEMIDNLLKVEIIFTDRQ